MISSVTPIFAANILIREWVGSVLTIVVFCNLLNHHIITSKKSSNPVWIALAVTGPFPQAVFVNRYNLIL